MLKLGDKVKDIVSGFSGTITSRTEFISGCVRFGVQPVIDKDGKLPDAQSFDENQLQPLDTPAVENSDGPSGGPERAPNRRD